MYGDWNKYEWGREQLASYISAFTGKGNITVGDGTGATHMAKKHVFLPVGTSIAPDIAAHEATHIDETDNDAYEAVRPEHRLVLNLLEDARMERKKVREKPGLYPQWQHLIDTVFPTIETEQWLLQAAKCIYIECAGYVYDRKPLKPKARKLLSKFDKTNIKWDVRNAKSTMDLVPIVPRVVALFDEPMPKQKQQPEQQQPAGQSADPFQQGAQQGGDGGDPSEASASGHTEDHENCPACKAIEEEERAEGKGVTGSRLGRTYDVDDERHRAETYDKYADSTHNSHPQSDVDVDGHDRATGGPSVNRLVERARTLAKQFDRVENNVKLRVKEDDSDDIVIRRSHSAAGSDAIDPDMPEAAQEWASDDKLFERTYGRAIDMEKLLPAKARGGLGYLGYKPMLSDLRDRTRDKAGMAMALDAEAQMAAIGHYLGRQVGVWLQSQDRDAMRTHERYGIFDPRRAYAMGAGRFDVYRNPPKSTKRRPVVNLSVDMSGSMGGYRKSEYGLNPSYHAALATWVLARALSQLRIPFEVTGFGGYHHVYVMKTYSMPWNERSILSTSSIMFNANGGTPAAEGLAFSLVRSLTRPEQRKIIIQVTDAEVADNTGALAKSIRAAGHTVIGIGIGTDDARTREFYGDGFSVDKASDLPGRFVALLRELTMKGKLR